MSIMQSTSVSGAAKRIAAGIAGGLVLLFGTAGIAAADGHYRYDRGWRGDHDRVYVTHRHRRERRWRRARRIDVYHHYEEEPPVVVVREVYRVPPPVVIERVVERDIYREVPAPRRAYRAAPAGRGAPNPGGLIGAAVGGLLGSRIGGGEGKLAATAAATIGGYLLGMRVFDRTYAR